MKRTYSKPDILFEDFSLSTAIAGTCGVKTNTPSANLCGYPAGEYNLFLTGVNGCTLEIDDQGQMFDSLCYHVFCDASRLFNS